MARGVRRIGYQWHLRRLIADRGMFATTDLIPHLVEVADRMCMSPRTVQSHLSRAFRKLGVASRRELREAAGRRPAG